MLYVFDTLSLSVCLSVCMSVVLSLPKAFHFFGMQVHLQET